VDLLVGPFTTPILRRPGSAAVSPA
jgi:hypothetical protein